MVARSEAAEGCAEIVWVPMRQMQQFWGLRVVPEGSLGGGRSERAGLREEASPGNPTNGIEYD